MVAGAGDPAAAAGTPPLPDDAASDVSGTLPVKTEVDKLMNMIHKLQKKVDELIENKNKMQNQIDSKFSKDEQWETSKNKMEVKGFDTKNIKRPGEWDGKKEYFMLWNVLFQAYMAENGKQF